MKLWCQYLGRAGLVTPTLGLVPGISEYLQYAHIRGLDNGVADLFSRWTGSPSDFSKLLSQVQDPVWVPVSDNLLDIDPEL